MAGHRAPDAPCRDASTGAPTRLFDVFAGPHFTLLGFGPDSATPLATVAAAYGDRVRTFRVDDHEGHAGRAYGVEGSGLVLVRPDNHVALGAGAEGGAEVVDYLKRLGC